MFSRDVLILKGEDVEALLRGREREIIDTVKAAYVAHAARKSSLPNSLFLNFPGRERDRIIALPAYLGQGFEVAGVKWVSSFPANLEKGMNRASAVIILNSSATGVPEVIMEGSLVSAKRTAASAALAARYLQGDEQPETVGVLGCGPINFETVSFLLTAVPGVKRLALFDVDAARAGRFKEKCRQLAAHLEVEVVSETRELFREATLTSIATNASRPHIFDLAACRPGSVVLHISLRDLAPEVILSCDNVVDDVEHVCRAQTSVHLAEQKVGHRGFVRCSLADILNHAAPAKRDPEAVTVFSPFGLGVLDLAIGQLATRLASEEGRGSIIESFLPDPYSAAH